MITRYDDGHSGIPYHSDNEHDIKFDSNIYCLTIGAQRAVNFRSTDRAQFSSCLPPSGSVYCMTRESQNYWEHSVPPCRKLVRNPARVSLTFRYLVDPSENVQVLPQISSHSPFPAGASLSDPPPAPRPDSWYSSVDSTPLSPPPPQSTKRVLFLTDSIHAQLNTSQFGSEIKCDKMLCMKLRYICQFEKLFEVVQITCVN